MLVATPIAKEHKDVNNLYLFDLYVVRLAPVNGLLYSTIHPIITVTVHCIKLQYCWTAAADTNILILSYSMVATYPNRLLVLKSNPGQNFDRQMFFSDQ